MLVKSANSFNWKPLDLTYMHDPDLTFKGHSEYFDEGFNFVLNDALATSQDISVNKHSNFYLTQPYKVPDILELKPKSVNYPIVYTTYLKFYRYNYDVPEDKGWFLKTENTRHIVGDTRVARTQLQNNNYFEVELLDGTYARIRHFDGIQVKYLTYDPDNRTRFYFHGRKKGYSRQCDPQVFFYIHDKKKHTILLTVKVDDVAYCIVPSFDTTLLYSFMVPGPNSTPVLSSANVDTQLGVGDDGLPMIVEARLTVEPLIESMPNIHQKVWHLRSQKLSPKILDLNTTWSSYATGLDVNTLAVNKGRSVENIKNNFLLTSFTNTLSAQWPKYLPEIEVCNPLDNTGQLNVDILPLKNQLTPENKLSRGNIYDSEDSVNHRLYHSVHTGTNQEQGYDSIHLGYSSGVTELTLPAGEVTYFHFPLITNPYVRLNVNDSKLVDEGAYASNSPMRSDKVFKRRSGDGIVEDFVDEKNGTWLCAWLSGAQDPNVRPIWMDRYFNPNYFTQEQALSAMNSFETEYDVTVRQAQQIAGDVIGPFFDKVSNLTFEPGMLYAYHHIGCGDVEQDIKLQEQENVLLTKELETYKDLDHVSCCHTITKTCNNDVITYELDSDRYGMTAPLNREGSFSISFNLTVDDWSKPFAHTIVGNYDYDGIAIYNEENVTPFIVLPFANTVRVYNTDFVLLKEIEITGTDQKPKNIQFLVKKESTNSFWILDEDNVIREFDMEGVERNRINEHGITSVNVPIVDFDIGPTGNIYLLRSPALSGDFIKLTPSLSGYDMTCDTAPVKAAESFSYYKCNQFGDFNPIIDPITGFITRYEHAAYVTEKVAQDAFAVNGRIYATGSDDVRIGIHNDGISQGVTLDNDGNTWYVLKDKLYHTKDPQTALGTAVATPVGISIDGVDSIQAINCDKHNNIWILYLVDTVYKLAKFRYKDELNRSSKIISTTELPIDIDSAAQYIEFLYEFTDKGYTEHIIVYERHKDGDTVIKLDIETATVQKIINLDVSTTPMLLESVVPKLPEYISYKHQYRTVMTDVVSGHDILHDDVALSGYDVWLKCNGELVEEPDIRNFNFTFGIDNTDSFTIEFYGDNQIFGYLDTEYMGTYERSVASTNDTYAPVRYTRVLTPGNHSLQFKLKNKTPGSKYIDNPLSLAFVVKDPTGQVIISSLDLDESNIVSLGKNPCANYFGQNSGTRSWKDVTGGNWFRNKIAQDSHTKWSKGIRVKLKAKNLYSGFLTKPQDSEFYLGGAIPQNIGIKSGSHHICVTYDAERGIARLWVDSLLADELDIGLGRYAFNMMLTRPLFLGTSNYFDNMPLFQYLRQPGYYMSGQNIKVSDFRVYGTPLNFYQVFSHTANSLNIRDIKWDLPSGSRNYIDTIERSFKFKTRDRKSNAFNLRIINSFVNDPDMKTELEKAINEYVKYVSPLHTNVQNIEWRNDTLGHDETTVMTTLTSNAY